MIARGETNLSSKEEQNHWKGDSSQSTQPKTAVQAELATPLRLHAPQPVDVLPSTSSPWPTCPRCTFINKASVKVPNPSPLTSQQKKLVFIDMCYLPIQDSQAAKETSRPSTGSGLELQAAIGWKGPGVEPDIWRGIYLTMTFIRPNLYHQCIYHPPVTVLLEVFQLSLKTTLLSTS